MLSFSGILDTVCGTLIDIYSAIPFVGSFLASITNTVCSVIGEVVGGFPL